MVHKKELRKVLNNFLKGSVRISEKELDREVMEKKLFVESILLLREIEDRRDFMDSELGIDMGVYESNFLQVIENLFKVHYNKEQFSLITYYLYTIPTLEDWDGKIDLSDGKEIVTVQFETPEDLFNVITSLKKDVKKFGRRE
jgi:hypothetical protein